MDTILSSIVNFDTLYDFIVNKMHTTHLYQPIMLKTVIESDTLTATVEDIAKRFLGHDKSQYNYYRKIVMRWPHKTLHSKHKILEYSKKTKNQDGIYTLDAKLSDEQKSILINLCQQKLDDFVGNDGWIMNFREQDKRNITPSLWAAVHAKCKGVCVSCGVKSTEQGLDVDHIIPISQGGKTQLENLQTLCVKCNRGKRDLDDTDFLLWHKRLQFRNPKCALCKSDTSLKDDIIESNDMAFSVKQESETIVIPRRHVLQFSDLIMSERQLCLYLVDNARKRLQNKDTFVRFDSHQEDLKNDHCTVSISYT